jgi:pimeloyl-ACP methyl ester carboxylesterase
VLATLCTAACLSFHPAPPPGAPEDAVFQEVDGVKLRYRDTGEGPPVVLVHGFSASSNTWEPIIPTLADDHRVIAMDLKGFGWSGRPAGDYSPTAQTRLVFELLDKLNVDRFQLVAHSWGSSIALRMALEQPDRIRRIALYDAYVYAEQLNTFFHWIRADGLGEVLWSAFYDQRLPEKTAIAYYDDETYVTQQLVEEFRDSVHRPGAQRAALAAARGQRYSDVQSRYSTVDQPVLLMWGREDRVTPVRFGERLVRQLPNARLEVYARCGHFPMVEARGNSTRDLMEFLVQDAPNRSADEADDSGGSR